MNAWVGMLWRLARNAKTLSMSLLLSGLSGAVSVGEDLDT
jgi:hypothetical protein